MARIDDLKRINEGDYDSKDRPLIRKLAGTLNNFMEEIIREFNGNIDFENLVAQKKTFKMRVDSNGVPTGNNLISVEKSNPGGIHVIRALDKTNPSSYPTQAPFINYKINNNQGNVLKILKITGLVANHDYDLTVLIIP